MVLTCKYCGKKGGVEGRTLHKFPLKDPKTLQLWLEEINLGPTFTPTNSSRLCSDHFRAECFDKKDTRVTIRPQSIPTLFGEYKSICAYCNASKANDEHLSFRKFPLENPELLEKWMKAMNLQNYVPTKKSVFCSNHFEENCFYPVGNTGYRRLKSTAVPSILTECGAVNSNTQLKRLSLEPSPTAKHQRLSDSLSPVSVVQENTSVTEQDISSTAVPEILTTPKSKYTPERPNTDTSKKLFHHDHSYETSPKSLRLKLISTQQKVRLLQSQHKVQKQHIHRLRRKIRTLKDIVSQLRKNKSIPESGVACLDAIADADVSQLVERFIGNKRSVGNQPQIEKKRPWKILCLSFHTLQRKRKYMSYLMHVICLNWYAIVSVIINS